MAAATPNPEREALIERLATNMPQAMRERAQWLLWKLEEVEGRKGLQKVPYYGDGGKRFGDLGSPKDRKRLLGLDAALQRFRRMPAMSGVGFAFLDGDGLVGIDLDWKTEPGGQPLEHHEAVMQACDSYTEFSPSGKGVHIITLGSTDSFKHDPIGVEVYCGGRYFTCTGARLESRAAEVMPLQSEALAYLREIVEASKKAAKAERRGPELAAAPSPAPAAAPMARHESPRQQGDDFRRVNVAAYADLARWVPRVLPMARTWRNGYRVTSKDLGRDLEEDLQITPEGIMDFGEELGMSPIDVVMKWAPGCARPKDALLWLASALGVEVQAAKPRMRLAASGGAPVPAPGPAEGAPPPDEYTLNEPPAKRRGKAGRSGGADAPPGGEGGGGVLQRLLKSFALVYGTDLVWDGEHRTTMQVKNLRLLFGSPFVNSWLGHPERRLLKPEQIVFEPGIEVAEGCVNLWGGMPTKPVPCTEADVAPILELLQHLCSLSGKTDEEVAAVYQQVLRWCALIVQRPGAKIRFALVFHGPQGTGKNLFWDAFRRILGKYGKMVGQSELDDRFNGYMSGKLLLIGNEVVTRQELFHQKNKLKWVITEDEIPIRGMHQEVRWESNHANVVFLSNELQPVALEKDDRRHLVIYTPAAESPSLYLRVAEFLRADGVGKFMHYLQGVDLGDFNEYTKPLMTKAKEALVEMGLKPAERFVNDWLGGYLGVPVHPCSATQLFTLFRRWADGENERYIGNQATFTRSVERHVTETVERDANGHRLPDALRYKPVAVVVGQTERRTVRCWIPRGRGPVNGVTEGEWMGGCIDDFEKHLARFGRKAVGEGEAS
jgi:putative DNA primase/helicase